MLIHQNDGDSPVSVVIRHARRAIRLVHDARFDPKQ